MTSYSTIEQLDRRLDEHFGGVDATSSNHGNHVVDAQVKVRLGGLHAKEISVAAIHVASGIVAEHAHAAAKVHSVALETQINQGIGGANLDAGRRVQLNNGVAFISFFVGLSTGDDLMWTLSSNLKRDMTS